MVKCFDTIPNGSCLNDTSVPKVIQSNNAPLSSRLRAADSNETFI